MAPRDDELADRHVAKDFELASSEPEGGQPFGRYLLLRKLGRGGMGLVVEAEDTKLRRRVAIKILPKGVAENAERLQRLLNEARANARLHHPHTLGVFDIDQHAGYHFIAMELIRGRSAEQLVRERGALQWQEATRIAADACRGLAAAHQAGVIHRDIKPSNILCRDDGVAKLADFGLARFLDQTSPSLTEAGSVMGTPLYMSPEQCDGERADEQSDIYSLGATYYTLLAGQPPFQADKAIQVMFAHRTKPAPDPRMVNEAVPEACAAIVQRAMAKLPKARYSSAAAMLADLEQLLPPGNLSSTHGSAGITPLANSQSRHSAQATPDYAMAETRPQTTAPRRSISRRGVLLGAGASVAGGVAVVIGLWGRAALREAGASKGWINLFDGRSLNGWTPTGNTAKQWSVENGELVGRGDNTFLLTDRSDFQDFHCRLTMSLSKGANSGLVFRCDAAAGGYPDGYEAQLGGVGSESDFGNLYCHFDQGHDTKLVPATSRVDIAPRRPFTLEVNARGARIQIMLDGQTVNDFTDPSPNRRTRGRLGLQAFNDQTEVRVSQMEVMRLEAR